MSRSLVPVGETIDIVLTYRGTTYHATGVAVQVDLERDVRPFYVLGEPEPAFAVGDTTLTIVMKRAAIEAALIEKE